MGMGKGESVERNENGFFLRIITEVEGREKVRGKSEGSEKVRSGRKKRSREDRESLGMGGLTLLL